MKNIIRIKDRYYILAKSSIAEEKTRVLKSNNMFGVFRQNGDIGTYGWEEHGLYFEDTRFLSKLTLNIENHHPLLLSSVIKDDNQMLVVDSTNPDIGKDGKILINKGDLHFLRLIFLRKQTYYEQLRITNYGLKTIEFNFSYHFGADYRDIFEIRGLKRKKRGSLHTPKMIDNGLEFSYSGLDDILRKTMVQFTPAPARVSFRRVKFRLKLKPYQAISVLSKITCLTARSPVRITSYPQAYRQMRHDFADFHRDECRLETTNGQFNDWMHRSKSDLLMMLTRNKEGLYPYAGIPWFSTVFGRDGLITALQTLWLNPAIAKGVLIYLSFYQAKEVIPQRDAEPGKILHEMRRGEMANLNEVPFGLYYGSVDATPLYLILAGCYYDRQGDLEFIRKIWPSLLAALQWIDKFGDHDKDGFVEYKRKAVGGGLSQQGWKDSGDSVFHANGELAEFPVAICEVQGYVFEAKLHMAKLARALGDLTLSQDLTRQAQELKKKFQKVFWCEDLKTYALALDDKKRPCLVRASNAGHCLFSGIAAKHHAQLIREQFSHRAMFSGWGIRTLAASEVRYNPMSYHNGSVWPHDNAIIAAGLSRYGFKEDVLNIMSALFDASFFMDLHRLPELFCGFKRRAGEGPTLYPVACNPQTWASASVFMCIQACLGLTIDGKNQVVRFDRPVLPPYIEELRICNLTIGKAKLDISLRYHKEDVGIRVVKRQGKVEIITRK